MDAYNFTLPIDNKVGKLCEDFAPYWTSMDVDRPYSISRFISLQGTGHVIVGNYLDDKTIDKTRKDTIVSKLNFVEV